MRIGEYMYDAEFTDLIKRFVREYKGPKLAITSAGGGASFADLLKVPGSARVVSSIRFPYERYAVKRCLSYMGKVSYEEKAVSSDVSIDLAYESFDFLDDVIAIGATSSLSSNRHRKGQNESWVTILWPQGGKQIDKFNLVYSKFDESHLVSLEQFEELRIKQDRELVSVCLVKLLEFKEF